MRVKAGVSGAHGVQGRGSPAAGAGPGWGSAVVRSGVGHGAAFARGFGFGRCGAARWGPSPWCPGGPCPAQCGRSCKHPGMAPIHTGEAAAAGCPTGQAPRCGLGRTRCPHCLRKVPWVSFSTLLNGDFLGLEFYFGLFGFSFSFCQGAVEQVCLESGFRLWKLCSSNKLKRGFISCWLPPRSP